MGWKEKGAKLPWKQEAIHLVDYNIQKFTYFTNRSNSQFHLINLLVKISITKAAVYHIDTSYFFDKQKLETPWMTEILFN